MTGPERDTSPAVKSIGDQLAAAWRAQETRNRRGRRLLVAAVAAVTLAIPGAFAASDLLVGTPGPQPEPSRNGRAVILTSGEAAQARWRLTAFHRGATACFGLRVVIDAGVFYADDCDAGFPAKHAVTVGTQTVGGQTFIYGATTANAARVRVIVGGRTVEAPLVEPDGEARRSAKLSAEVRVFMIAIAHAGAIPPTVVVLSADGRIVGRP